MAIMLGAQLKNKAPWTPYSTHYSRVPKSGAVRAGSSAGDGKVQIDAQLAFMLRCKNPVTQVRKTS